LREPSRVYAPTPTIAKRAEKPVARQISAIKIGLFTIVCGYSDGLIQVWKGSSLTPPEIYHGGSVLWLEIVDNDHTILSFGADYILKIWHTSPSESSQPLCDLQITIPRDITSLHHSIGYLLAFGKDRALCWNMRDLGGNYTISSWEGSHLGFVQCLPDSKTIAVSHRKSREIQLWTFENSSLVSGKLLLHCFCRVSVPSEISSLHVNIIDHIVLCSCVDSVHVVDMCTGYLLRKIRFPLSRIMKVWWTQGVVYTLMGGNGGSIIATRFGD